MSIIQHYIPNIFKPLGCNTVQCPIFSEKPKISKEEETLRAAYELYEKHQYRKAPKLAKITPEGSSMTYALYTHHPLPRKMNFDKAISAAEFASFRIMVPLENAREKVAAVVKCRPDLPVLLTLSNSVLSTSPSSIEAFSMIKNPLLISLVNLADKERSLVKLLMRTKTNVYYLTEFPKDWKR